MVEFKSDWNLLHSVPTYSAKYSAKYGADPDAQAISPDARRGGDTLLTRR